MTLRIRHKVILPALAIIVVLLAPAIYSVTSIVEINRYVRDMNQRLVPGTLATSKMRGQLDEFIVLGVTAAHQDPNIISAFQSRRTELEGQLKALIGSEPGGPDVVHHGFRRAMSDLERALEGITPDTPVEAVQPAAQEARVRLLDLERYYSERVESSIQDVAGLSRRATRFTLYAILAGLLVSLLVWLAILLSLGRPLRDLVAGTERVAKGRFDEPIPVRAQDELGTLSDAFNRMAASLSELDRMKAEFVASASHELRTPLACIKGFASLLRAGSRGSLTEDQRATLQQIEDQADQMNDFVGQLLDLSRLRAGRAAMNKRWLPSEAFFSSVARGFEGMADRKKIDYEMRIADDVPARIHADPDRLREVVNNLLGNAFKFTQAGGEVRFSAEADGDWVRVTVSDTGPGIPEEDLPYIFEKYYRGAGSGVSQHEGAGLGLAISRGVVEKHGGRIWVENRGGHGARFVFRIPAVQPADVTRPEGDRQIVGAKET